MIILGLTGNIASGKTEVASMFRKLGASIIDADQIARDVVEKGTPGWEEVVDHFGSEILDNDGSINRKALGGIVFSNREKLQKLNEITHPRIMEEIRKRIEILKQNDIQIVVIEAALIVEKGGMKDLVDKLVVVKTEENIQLERLMERNGMTREDAKDRIESQLPLSEKLKYADFVIDNSGDLEKTRKQVREIMNKLAPQERRS